MQLTDNLFQHSLQRSVGDGSESLVAPANMVASNKDVRNGPLTSQIEQSLLNRIAVGSNIELVDLVLEIEF